MNKELKAKLLAKNKWIRFLLMVLFIIIMIVVKFIVWFIVAFQFIATLFTNEPNKQLLEFSKNLCTYFYQVLLFLTYNSEIRPFPFSSWPSDKKQT